MRKRSVIRDTIQMTVIQFFLECLALWFNAWMTRRVGAATVGTLAQSIAFLFSTLPQWSPAEMLCSVPAVLCPRNWGSPAAVRHVSCGMVSAFA